jgi:hypothetical protein
MAEIGLQRSGIDAFIGQRVAASMPKHVGVHLEANLGFVTGSFPYSVGQPKGVVAASAREQSRSLALNQTGACSASCSFGDAVKRAANPLHCTRINAKPLGYLTHALSAPRRLCTPLQAGLSSPFMVDFEPAANG